MKIARAIAAMLLTTGAAEAQVSGDAIRIGVLNDRSGIYSDLAGEGSAVAARMAAEEFGGTVLGKPVEILTADHQNRPDVGAGTVRRWLDREGVDAVADVPTSSVALAVQEVTRDGKAIFLMSGPATTALTGAACSPYGFHWTYDTHALATGTARSVVERGGDTWFFLTSDYEFGHQLERDTAEVVKAMEGRVLGGVRHPIGTADFASFLLQAQGSGAEVIGLANAGNDTTTAIKQASNFGITQSGQDLAALLLFISDVHALGLNAAEGLYLTTGFYWDLDDQTRAWSREFEKRTGSMPTMVQAGVYSAVRHYLEAVRNAGTDDPDAVAERMRATPVEDMFAHGGKILPNGRMVHDMYLARVKAPSESRGPWDYYEIVRTIPGAQAYMTAKASGCALVASN
jgi:branched-chain amino acid transport system substrate-binding protein